MSDRFKDIDKVLKASDIVWIFEEQYEKSEANIIRHSRSDGYAKRGKSTALLAASQYSFAAQNALNTIEREMNNRIEDEKNI